MKHKEIFSDEDIIEKFFLREEKAIQMTDEKYGNMLFRIAYNVLHDKLDSEECMNDTYLETWNAIPPARPRVFPAFITQIIKRISINRYKEKNAKKRIPSDYIESLDNLADCLGTADEVDAYELGKLISEFVRSLPERRQFIFIGRYYMAQTPQNLADELSVGIATVYREIERIKNDMRNYLIEKGAFYYE